MNYYILQYIDMTTTYVIQSQPEQRMFTLKGKFCFSAASAWQHERTEYRS